MESWLQIYGKRRMLRVGLMTVKAAKQAQERRLGLIIVLKSTTEPPQWTRTLSLLQLERRSGRKRCAAGNDLPTMRIQRRRQRRKSPEERVQRTITPTLTRRSRMVLKGYLSHVGPRSRRIGLFPPFLTAK